jgi:hypothetical protein
MVATVWNVAARRNVLTHRSLRRSRPLGEGTDSVDGGTNERP